MKKADYESAKKDIIYSYRHAVQPISAILNGPAVFYVNQRKKRAGIRGSRGSYISEAIEFYEYNKVGNQWGEVETLKRQVLRLQKVRERLQFELHKLQESGN